MSILVDLVDIVKMMYIEYMPGASLVLLFTRAIIRRNKILLKYLTIYPLLVLFSLFYLISITLSDLFYLLVYLLIYKVSPHLIFLNIILLIITALFTYNVIDIVREIKKLHHSNSIIKINIRNVLNKLLTVMLLLCIMLPLIIVSISLHNIIRGGWDDWRHLGNIIRIYRGITIINGSVIADFPYLREKHYILYYIPFSVKIFLLKNIMHSHLSIAYMYIAIASLQTLLAFIFLIFLLSYLIVKNKPLALLVALVALYGSTEITPLILLNKLNDTYGLSRIAFKTSTTILGPFGLQLLYLPYWYSLSIAITAAVLVLIVTSLENLQRYKALVLVITALMILMSAGSHLLGSIIAILALMLTTLTTLFLKKTRVLFVIKYITTSNKIQYIFMLITLLFLGATVTIALRYVNKFHFGIIYTPKEIHELFAMIGYKFGFLVFIVVPYLTSRNKSKKIYYSVKYDIYTMYLASLIIIYVFSAMVPMLKLGIVSTLYDTNRLLNYSKPFVIILITALIINSISKQAKPLKNAMMLVLILAFTANGIVSLIETYTLHKNTVWGLTYKLFTETKLNLNNYYKYYNPLSNIIKLSDVIIAPIPLRDIIFSLTGAYTVPYHEWYFSTQYLRDASLTQLLTLLQNYGTHDIPFVPSNVYVATISSQLSPSDLRFVKTNWDYAININTLFYKVYTSNMFNLYKIAKINPPSISPKAFIVYNSSFFSLPQDLIISLLSYSLSSNNIAYSFLDVNSIHSLQKLGVSLTSLNNISMWFFIDIDPQLIRMLLKNHIIQSKSIITLIYTKHNIINFIELVKWFYNNRKCNTNELIYRLDLSHGEPFILKGGKFHCNVTILKDEIILKAYEIKGSASYTKCAKLGYRIYLPRELQGKINKYQYVVLAFEGKPSKNQLIFKVYGKKYIIQAYTKIILNSLEGNTFVVININKLKLLKNVNYTLSDVLSEAKYIEVYSYPANNLFLKIKAIYLVKRLPMYLATNIHTVDIRAIYIDGLNASAIKDKIYFLINDLMRNKYRSKPTFIEVKSFKKHYKEYWDKFRVIAKEAVICNATINIPLFSYKVYFGNVCIRLSAPSQLAPSSVELINNKNFNIKRTLPLPIVILKTNKIVFLNAITNRDFRFHKTYTLNKIKEAYLLGVAGGYLLFVVKGQ